jgi:hypothetical protein
MLKQLEDAILSQRLRKSKDIQIPPLWTGLFLDTSLQPLLLKILETKLV